MRNPKSSRAAELELQTDEAVTRVFELLREHRDALEPPSVRQAYKEYLLSLSRELDEEDASQSRTSNARPQPDSHRQRVERSED